LVPAVVADPGKGGVGRRAVMWCSALAFRRVFCSMRELIVLVLKTFLLPARCRVRSHLGLDAPAAISHSGAPMSHGGAIPVLSYPLSD
jgi:hypothetical protein